ncbi:MAG: MFS transporter [Lewinellaceae bacterium]|nr:MFS transporter [Lewinellaceae bacterium]
MVVVFLSIYLTQHLGYGIREAGYVLGCFGAGALLGGFLGGKLTDRFSYYPIMLWSLILNGVVLIFLQFIQDFWVMCGIIFLLSAISDIFRPANAVAIARYSSPEKRTRSISLYRMSINLGWTIAPALGGLLVALGWHWLFVADGITCILAAVLLWIFIAPKPAPASAEPAIDSIPVIAAPKISPYRDRTFLLFPLLSILNAIIFMQFIWTVPIFFKETYHWDEHTIGLVAAVNGLIIFLVEMPLIYRVEGRRSRLQFVRMGLVLYTLSFLAFLLPPGGMITALLFVIALSIGEMFVMPFSTNFVFDYATKGSAGSYMGAYTISYSLANIIAPLLGTQIIAHWGYTTNWFFICCLAVLSWIGFWVLERKTGG